MKLNLKTVVGSVATLAVAGGMLMAGASSASAATTPTYEPDPAAVGTVAFYDATGHQITTGGLNDAPQAAYYKTSGGPIHPGDTDVTMAYYTPIDGTLPVTWQSADQVTSTLPAEDPATLPGDLHNTSGMVLKGQAIDFPVQFHLDTFPLTSTANPNVIQVRVFTNPDTTSYYASDIQVDTAAGTWTQVYPTVVVSTPTTTTLTATPDPSVVGNTVTLHASVSPATAAGTVQFKDGATNIGAPVTVASAAAQTTVSTLTQGSHSLSAVFTPTDTAAFGTSTGTFTATVNPPSTPTTTTLAVGGGNTTAGSPATLTATVTGPGTTPNGSGTVSFFDNGSATALPGTVDASTAGTYILTLPAGFTAGNHSIVAKFTPTSVTQFQASQSAAASFFTAPVQVGACAQPGSQCTDTQNIQANIPVGTLVINTPYTSANPLDLGDLVLSADSTQYSGSATFENINVTDTRAGNVPWTISALSSNLTDGGTNPNSIINAQNVGLTDLVNTPGTGFTGTVVTSNNAAADPAVAPGDTGSLGLGGTTAHTVATTTHGIGSTSLNGKLTLTAPSSTEAGLFTGTITFTIG